jgi:hypothetical protein
LQRQAKVEPRLRIARLNRFGPFKKLRSLGKLSGFQPLSSLAAEC